jgi:PleD family two-component response regulator
MPGVMLGMQRSQDRVERAAARFEIAGYTSKSLEIWAMSHTLLGSSTSESYSSGRVVTVVDDEITTREAIQAILEYDGYEVWAFADAVSAHRRLTAARPDLVILDMMLRGRSGRAFLERLKSEPTTAAIPVISARRPGWAPRTSNASDSLAASY